MQQNKNHKIYLATISILLKDRTDQAPRINQILTEHSQIIISRLGTNVQRRCIEHCTAIITIVVEGSAKEISNLTKKIDGYYGIVAKSNILTS